MNLPRLAVPEQQPTITFDEGVTIAVGNELIRQVEDRINSLVPSTDDASFPLPRLAEVELDMYAVIRHPKATLMDKLESILRLGYHYEARAVVKTMDYRFCGSVPNMQGRHQFAELTGRLDAPTPEAEVHPVPSRTLQGVGVS